MRLFATLLICLLPLGLLAQSSPEQPTGTINIQDSDQTDRAIENRIRAILQELEGYEAISVNVSAGIVTLRGTTLDSSAAQRLTYLAGRVQGVVAIENEVTETTDVVQRLNPAVERFKARLSQIIAFLPLALIAFGVFGLIVLLGFFIARRKQPWNRLAPNAFIADIYRQIIRLLFALGGLVIALDIVGATALLSGILGAAGIVGLAIGFAVRDTVENFIASILLSIRQPFRPNDTVEIEGDIGKVIRLTSRATILLSFDGNHIRIPNAIVYKSRIVNYSRNDERRFTFGIGVAPDTDLAATRKLAQETLTALPFILKTPEASVWVNEVGDSTINLKMSGWIDQTNTDVMLARSEAIRLVMSAFDNAGISMPEPTYRLMSVDIASTEPPHPVTKSTTEKPSEAAVEPVNANADKELERIVDQERADAGNPDLLNENAAEE